MKRCPLCRIRPTNIGWCGACRSSFRARNLSHGTVMDVAQFGADRAREGLKEARREPCFEEGATARKENE